MEAETGVSQPQGCLESPEARRGKERFLQSRWGERGHANTLISDFWPPKLWKKKFPLF